MNLFRPAGVYELRLIAASAWRAFPPRLPGQPIFYLVLDYDYAVQIARDWNRNDQASGFAGFVTSFAIEAAFASQFDVQVVLGRQHRELWVPAAQLSEFNGHIIGRIEVLASFYGERCKEGDKRFKRVLNLHMVNRPYGMAFGVGARACTAWQ